MQQVFESLYSEINIALIIAINKDIFLLKKLMNVWKHVIK